MSSIATYFLEGGWSMFAIAAFGIFAWFFGFVALLLLVLKKSPLALIVFSVLAILTSLLTLSLGAVGYFTGMAELESAVALVDPSSLDALRAEGERIVIYPVYWALIMGVPPLMDGVLGAFVGYGRRAADTYED